MSSTGVTPLGPLYRDAPLHSTSLSPTLNKENGYVSTNNITARGADVDNRIVHQTSVFPVSSPTPHSYNSYSYNSLLQTPASLTGMISSTPLLAAQQQPQSVPLLTSTAGPSYVASVPANSSGNLDAGKLERVKQSSSAVEASQLRAQVRALEHEIQELRQGLAQNASIGHRHAQAAPFVAVVNGSAVPAARRSKNVPKVKPDIAFNRRVVNPLGIRSHSTTQSKTRGNGREGRAPTESEGGHNLEFKQRPSTHPTPAVTAAAAERADCAVVNAPLFVNSREIPLRGQAEGGTLLPISSSSTPSGSCLALDKTQPPASQNAPQVSFSPLSETSKRDHCWLSADFRPLDRPGTEQAKPVPTTTGSKAYAEITSTSAAPSPTGVGSGAKSLAISPPSAIPSSPTHATMPSAAAGSVGASLGEIAAGTSTADAPPSSVHQAALQYLTHELSKSRQEAAELQRAAAEQDARCSQLQLHLDARTAELSQLQTQLKAAQEEIWSLRQVSPMHAAGTNHATGGAASEREALTSSAAVDVNPTIASPDSKQPHHSVTPPSNTTLNFMQSDAMPEVQAQLIQAKDQINALSKKLAAWELWYMKQRQKCDNSSREKRRSSRKEGKREIVVNADNAKVRNQRARPNSVADTSFPIGFVWPAGCVESRPVPCGLVYPVHDEATPQAFHRQKRQNHGHKRGEAEYGARPNIILKDPFDPFYANQVTGDASMGSVPLLPVGGTIPELDSSLMEFIAKERAIREISTEGQKFAEARLRAVLLAERRPQNVNYLNRAFENETVSTGSVSSNEGSASQCLSEAPIEVQLSTTNS